MSREWLVCGFVIGTMFGTAIGMVFYAAAVATRVSEPPCHYGASEIIVREADGKAHMVCGCPR